MFGIPLLVIVGIVVVFGIIATLIAINLRIVVPTNMVHIVQRRKTTIPYGKGRVNGNCYYKWPSWIPRIGITVITFPESIFQVELQSYDAYDSARLPFIVDVIAFFRVDAAETVAQRVSSFSELREQLKNVLQGSVRSILAKNKLESIMTERSIFGDQFTDEVKTQITEWGVLPVKTIEFMDIRDSKGSAVIENIMSKEKSRIEKESRIAVANNSKDAQLQEVDAKRTVQVQTQDAEEQVGIRTAQKDQQVGIANQQAKQEVLIQQNKTVETEKAVMRTSSIKQAEIDRDVAVIDANKAQMRQTIDAETARKTMIINTEAMRDANILKAEGERTAKVTQSEGEKDSKINIAEGNLKTSLFEAQGIEAVGKAKGAAEQASLMAPVNAQITLATEIGENQEYQKYLIEIKKIDVNGSVGIEMAKAMGNADMKIISNAGDIQSGMSKITDLFTSQGGTKVGSMVSALMNNPDILKIVESLTSKKSE